jgi:hypothetical protein
VSEQCSIATCADHTVLVAEGTAGSCGWAGNQTYIILVGKFTGVVSM